jgi:hypothetical protein
MGWVADGQSGTASADLISMVYCGLWMYRRIRGVLVGVRRAGDPVGSRRPAGGGVDSKRRDQRGIWRAIVLVGSA